MNWSKPAKVILGVFSLWPFVYMFLFMGYAASIVLSIGRPDATGAEGLPPGLPPGMGALFVGHIATMVLMFVLLAIYFVFLYQTDRVAENKKVLWAVLLFAGNMLAMPVFFYLYVWPGQWPAGRAVARARPPLEAVTAETDAGGLVTRPAGLADAGALAGLLEELGFPAAAPVVAERLATLARAGERVLVGVLDGAVVGFVSVHVTPVLHRPTPVGRMTALVVARRLRRQGLGRQLVAAAERHVAGVGCALIEVTSHHRLTEAHAFYQRLGYAATSHRFGKVLVGE